MFGFFLLFVAFFLVIIAVFMADGSHISNTQGKLGLALFRLLIAFGYILMYFEPPRLKTSNDSTFARGFADIIQRGGDALQWVRVLLEINHDIIYTISLTGAFLYVSPSVERILGYSTKSRLGRPLLIFVIHPILPQYVMSSGTPQKELVLQLKRKAKFSRKKPTIHRMLMIIQTSRKSSLLAMAWTKQRESSLPNLMYRYINMCLTNNALLQSQI